MNNKRLDATLYLLKQKRIPTSLTLRNVSLPLTYDNLIDVYKELPEKYREKIKVYFNELYGKSIIITGEDCHLKDEIAIAFLVLFASMNLKVFYYASPDDFDGNIGFVTAIMRVDTSKNAKLNSAITSALIDKKIVILSANSLSSMATYLGNDLVNLIAVTDAVELKVEETKAKTFVQL